MVVLAKNILLFFFFCWLLHASNCGIMEFRLDAAISSWISEIPLIFIKIELENSTMLLARCCYFAACYLIWLKMSSTNVTKRNQWCGIVFDSKIFCLSARNLLGCFHLNNQIKWRRESEGNLIWWQGEISSQHSPQSVKLHGLLQVLLLWVICVICRALTEVWEMDAIC